ncbi:hypothetical protein [Sphingorhabdus sp.]
MFPLVDVGVKYLKIENFLIPILILIAEIDATKIFYRVFHYNDLRPDIR